jgi:hypothetical protein
MTSTKRAVCIPMANGIAMINGTFTSIHDVASTSQTCTTAAIRRWREGITKK